MTDSWREWEGRTVDGQFVLGSYLGGSDGSAVFRTRIGDAPAAGKSGAGKAAADPSVSIKDAAIKLVPLTGAGAESQLRRWQAAIELNHPNLLRILAVGHATVDGSELVYAVEELAEENLAQIVPERALAPEEVRGMLAPVLAALEFLHSRGLVHGRIRPSNILAAGDQVKLSSDSLRPTGEIPPTVNAYDAPEVLADGVSPASDVWSLGITLVEVLTQRVPVWDPARMEIAAPNLDKNIPEPFRGIVKACLQVDPAQRPGLHEIASRLDPGKLDPGKLDRGKLADQKLGDQKLGDQKKERLDRKSTPVGILPRASSAPPDARAASARKRANGPYLLVLAVAIAVIIFLIVRPRPSTGPAEDHASPTPPQASSSQTSSSQPASAQPNSSQTTAPQKPSPQTSSPAMSPSQSRPTGDVKPSPAQTSASAVQPASKQKTVADDEVVERSAPQVSRSAQRTIHGKIKVRVSVAVDASGNVTEAKLKDAGPSEYFARAALEAARRWKFAPEPNENRRDWILLFAFGRGKTEMSASQAR